MNNTEYLEKILMDDYDGSDNNISLDNLDINSVIDKVSKEYPRVPKNIVISLIQQESGFNPFAEIWTGDKYGYARGLGQFIDETAKKYIPDWKSAADSYDPVKSIYGVFNYLDDLYLKYGNWYDALRYYHGIGSDILGETDETYANKVLQRAKTDIKPYLNISTNDLENILMSDSETEIVQEQPKVEMPQLLTMEIKSDFFPRLKNALSYGVNNLVSSIARFVGYQKAASYSPFGSNASWYNDIIERGKKVEKLLDLAFDKEMDINELQKLYENIDNSDLMAYDFYKKMKKLEDNANEKSRVFFDIARGLDEELPKPYKEEIEKAIQRISDWNLVKERIKKFDIIGLVSDAITASVSQIPNLIVAAAGSALESKVPVPITTLSFGAMEGGNIAKQLEQIGCDDPKIIAKYSILAGIPSGEIEKQSDLLLTTPFKHLIKTIFKGNKNAMDGFIKGFASKSISKTILGSLSNTLGLSFVEGSEELLQGDISDLAITGALTEYVIKNKDRLSEEDLVKFRIAIEEYGKRTFGERFNDFLGGFISSLPLITPANVSRGAIDIASILSEEKGTNKNFGGFKSLKAFVEVYDKSTEKQRMALRELLTDKEREELNNYLDDLNKKRLYVTEELFNRYTPEEQELLKKEYGDDLIIVKKSDETQIERSELSDIRKSEKYKDVDLVESKVGNVGGFVKTEIKDEENKPMLEVFVHKRPKKMLKVQDIFEEYIKSDDADKLRLRSLLTEKENEQLDKMLEEKGYDTDILLEEKDKTEVKKEKIFEDELLEKYRFYDEKGKVDIELTKLKPAALEILNKIEDEQKQVDVKPVEVSGILQPEQTQKENVKKFKPYREKDIIDVEINPLLNKINEISKEGLVAYNPEEHKDIIKEITVSENKPIVKFNNKELEDIIGVNIINDKPYLYIKDESLDKIEEIKAREGGFYQKIYNIEDIEDISNIDNKDKEVFVSKLRQKVENQYNNNEINLEAYNRALKYIRAYEHNIGLKEYENEDFSDIKFSKQELDTETIDKMLENIDKIGEEIAKKIGGIRYDKTWKDLKIDGKYFSMPLMQFSIIDNKIETTLAIPITATEDEIRQRIKEKKEDYFNRRIFGVIEGVKKIIKNIPNDVIPEIETSDKSSFNLGDDIAATYVKDGKNVVVINSKLNINEIVPALLHELLGHFGANGVFSVDKDLYNYAKNLYIKYNDSELVEELRHLYNKHDVFEEWIAKNIEIASKKYFDEFGQFNEEKFKKDRGVMKQIYETIKKLVKKILSSWFDIKETNEVENLSNAILYKMGELYNVRYEKENIFYKKNEQKESGLRYVARNNILKALNKEQLIVDVFNFLKRFVGSESERQSYAKQFDFYVYKYKDFNVLKEKTIEMIDDIIYVKEIKNSFKEAIKNKDIPKEIRDNIKEIYDKVMMYNTLKRVYERERVERPQKNGNFLNPSTKYKNLIKAGFIDMEEFKNGFYKLNKDGIDALDKIKKELKEKQIDKDYILSLLQKEKEAGRLLDIDYKKNVEEIKTKLSKIDAKNKSNILRKTIAYIGEKFKKYFYNIEAVIEEIDNDVGEKVLANNFFNYILEAEKNRLSFKHKIDSYLKEALSYIPRDVLIKMSPYMHKDVLSTILEKVSPTHKKYKMFVAGEVIEMNISQKISLYMLLQNKAAQKHILEGGFSLTPDGKIYKPSIDDITSFLNSMTNIELYIANLFFEIGDIIKEEGNKISIMCDGKALFTEENYHPILVREDYIEFKEKTYNDISEYVNTVLKASPSSLKERKYSGEPLILEGVFEAFSRVLPVTEKYIGTRKQLMICDSIIKDSDVKRVFYDKGLSEEYDIIVRLYNDYKKDILRKQDPLEFLTKLYYSVFAVAALGYNPNTVAIQTSAVFSVLSQQNDFKTLLGLFRPLTPKKAKEYENIIKKYSPFLKERFDSGYGEVLGSITSSTKIYSLMKPNAFILKKIFSSETSMRPITAMDKNVIIQSFNAMLFAKKKELGRDLDENEIKDLVNTLETNIRQGQATSLPFDKNLFQSSIIGKAFSIFQSEAFKRIYLTQRLIHNIKTNPIKSIEGLIYLWVLQPLYIEAIRTALLSARGKWELPEDEQELLLYILKRYTFNIISALPALGDILVTYAKEIFDDESSGSIRGIEKGIFGIINGEILTIIRTLKSESLDDEEKLIKILTRIERISESFIPIRGLRYIYEMLINISSYIKEEFLD